MLTKEELVMFQDVMKKAIAPLRQELAEARMDLKVEIRQQKDDFSTMKEEVEADLFRIKADLTELKIQIMAQGRSNFVGEMTEARKKEQALADLEKRVAVLEHLLMKNSTITASIDEI